jgi:hypothetical protein
MKKALVVFFVMLSLAGCSNDNKIVIQNLAAYDVYVNFRAQIYDVPGTSTAGVNGGSRTIPSIPNGTYQYKTMWFVPDNSGLSISPAAESDGNLTFTSQQTKIFMQYGSITQGNSYIGSLTVTSSTSTTSSTTDVVSP